MNWTGERMLTGYSTGKGAIEHLHRYSIVMPFVKGKVVLDLASGEGYGSNLIAECALSVTGVDISKEAILHASDKYKRDNLKFLEGSATAIPMRDHAVDVIVSFETLEHHDRHNEMMAEFIRVLKKEGILIISSPERDNYRKIDPNNPFHIKELSCAEFENLLREYFNDVSIYHQRFFDASFIYPRNKQLNNIVEYTGDFIKIDKVDFINNHYFNIAICTNQADHSMSMNPSFFNGKHLLENMQNDFLMQSEQKIKQAVQQVQNSTSYRIGNFFIHPLSLLKKLFQ